MKKRRHVLTWRREARLAIASLRVPVVDVVHDLSRVDEVFAEIDAFEQDPTIDALLFLPGDTEGPASSLRDIVEETQGEARSAPEHGKLSFLRSFNVLSRFAVRLSEYGKLVAVAWRGAIDPVYFGIGLAASLRIAADDTELAIANPEMDLPPLGGLSYLLPAYLGVAQAHSMLLAGRPLSAARARELNLVDVTVDSADFEASALREAQRLVRHHVEVLRQNRPIVRVDSAILREHLRDEMLRLESACDGLVIEPQS